MSEMIVQVRNKILRRIGGVNHFVSHNKDYTIQFQFDESWNNVRTKMAVFAYEDGEYGSEIFDGDTCNVPEFPREGRILIGVKAGEDLSTELLCIPVCKSADDVITDEYNEPDPKIYEQILDIINNLWNGGTTVYPSPVKFLASPSTAKVGDLIRVKEVDENGDVTRTEGFDVGVELEKKIDAPQVAQVGEVLIVEEVDAEGKPKKWKTQAMDVADVVKFTEQDLTYEQAEQARKNIRVVGGKELNGLGELEVGSDTSFCVVKDYDTTSSNLGLTHDEFPMLIIKSAHIWYGRQNFYALSSAGKLYNGVVGNGIEGWNEMTKRIVVNVSRTEEESGATVMSTDKTYYEIDTSIKNNCDVALKLDDHVFTWSQTVKNGNYNTYVFQNTDVQHSRILSIEITSTSAGKTVVQQLTRSTPILMTNEITPPRGSVVTWIESGYGLFSIDEILYYTPVHSILLNSSTEGSTKIFRITVDDSGTLSATELV